MCFSNFLNQIAQLSRRWYRLILLFLTTLIFYIVLHCTGLNLVSVSGFAHSVSSEQLVQQGVEQYQSGDFAAAITTWQQALGQVETAQEQAMIHNNLAKAYQQTGEIAQAIDQWEQSIRIYKDISDVETQQMLSQILVEQAQAYGELGQYRRSIPLICSALTITEELTAGCCESLTVGAIADDCRPSTTTVAMTDVQSPRTRVAAWGALANAYAATGKYEQAEDAYRRSQELAQVLGDPGLQTTTLNNLANFYVRQAERYQFQAKAAEQEGDRVEASKLTTQQKQSFENASQAYEQSWQVSQTIGGLTEATALLNWNRSLSRSNSVDPTQVFSNQARIEQLLTNVPNSSGKAFALTNLAVQLMPLEKTYPPQPQLLNDPNWQHSQDLLNWSLQVARAIEDLRAESFALGSLGRTEEAAGRYGEAMQLTRNALDSAQQISAFDSLYRWQWQSGRILRAIGQGERAIQSYGQAVATLEAIRGDIVSASQTNQDVQFSFQDAVEPVYRERMELLLEAASPDSSSILMTEDKVGEMLKTLELLRLAELQNFFGDECVQVAQDRIEQNGRLIDNGAAVLYSVVLPNRVEMILRTPDGTLRHYPIKQPDGTLIPTVEFQAEVNQLREQLEKRGTDEYIDQARRIYDLLIRPLENDLKAAQPRTLVLVNDDVLRNVPLAALHDGQQFLVEKYAIATTPGLSLTSGTPMNRRSLKALTVGLTNAEPPFFPLPYVQKEIEEVQKTIGGKELLDQSFTLDKMQAQLKQEYYPIVHIATHGRFGVDASSTFLLAYDNKELRIGDIDALLQTRMRPVELLTLSACQTAAGDNRTTLGIAGLAVRAGVKSALATLWFINDEATVPLIEKFYQYLRDPALTKAEALQKAQQEMLKNRDRPEYNHPAVWAPFILVGNWL